MQPVIRIDIYGAASDQEDDDYQSPGGFAAIINPGSCGGSQHRIAGGDPRTDIGEMTMKACAQALRAVKWAANTTQARVELHTNFEYMVTLFKTPAASQGCKLPIWREILLEAAFLDVTFVLTRDIPQNCRQLALAQIRTSENSKSPFVYHARD